MGSERGLRAWSGPTPWFGELEEPFEVKQLCQPINELSDSKSNASMTDCGSLTLLS
jgi:hypothetical protein